MCGPPRPLCDWGGEGVQPPVRDALESVGVRASHLHLTFHADSERRPAGFSLRCPRRTLRRLPRPSSHAAAHRVGARSTAPPWHPSWTPGHRATTCLRAQGPVRPGPRVEGMRSRPRVDAALWLLASVASGGAWGGAELGRHPWAGEGTSHQPVLVSSNFKTLLAPPPLGPHCGQEPSVMW